MNREIKFRGLRLDGLGFVKGNYMHTVYKDKDDKLQIYPPLYNVPPVDIKPETVGQYTGLEDKNGVEIYEGDIIKYIQHHFNTPMIIEKIKQVRWKYDRWNVYETNAGESEIEVIGNIHENKELLK